MQQPAGWLLGPPSKALAQSPGYHATGRVGVEESSQYWLSVLSVIFYNATLSSSSKHLNSKWCRPRKLLRKNVKCVTEELRLQLFCKSRLETVVIRIVAELENNPRKENCYREPRGRKSWKLCPRCIQGKERPLAQTSVPHWGPDLLEAILADAGILDSVSSPSI